MTLHHLTWIQASASICGSTCEQLIPFNIWSAAVLGSRWWAQSSDSRCVESCCRCFTRNVPSWLNVTSLLTWHKWAVIFAGGSLTPYRACRAGRWLWWCARTPLRVCGSPIPHPAGRTAAPSALLLSAGRSCPTLRGTWLHGEKQGQRGKLKDLSKLLDVEIV